MVQLHQQYGDRVHVITLNVDFDETGEPSNELRERVLAMLKRSNVTCENLLCSDAMEDVLGELEILGLPAAMVYDAEGNLLRRFDGKVDYENEILPLIEQTVGPP